MASDRINAAVTLDSETGEVDQLVICLKSTPLTCEELRVPGPRCCSHQSTFRIPASAQSKSFNEDDINVQHEIQISGVNLTVFNTQHISIIAFVLPTLLLFPAWTAIMGVICEASCHIWSHRSKNSEDNQPAFRSPFNLISSQFCAKCKTEKWMHKISKIQDKRSLRRNLIDPSFIKHVMR